MQIIPAFYKARGTGGPEAQQELDRYLTEFEKELADKKFIGGELSQIFSWKLMQVYNEIQQYLVSFSLKFSR